MILHYLLRRGLLCHWQVSLGLVNMAIALSVSLHKGKDLDIFSLKNYDLSHSRYLVNILAKGLNMVYIYVCLYS